MGRLRLTCKRAAPRRKRGPGGPLHGAHFSVSTGRFQGYGRQRVAVFTAGGLGFARVPMLSGETASPAALQRAD